MSRYGRSGTIPERLARHLEAWLGTWRPPGEGELIVVGSGARTAPGWDGRVRPVAGIETLNGAVLSVAPGRVDAVRALGTDLDTVGVGLADALDLPGWRFGRGVFRWSDRPTPPGPGPLGIWLPTDDPRVPAWLQPFNGDVLVGFGDDDRTIAAGVGRKQHDAFGHELAVVTEEPFRGRGWARRLVSQAALRVLDDGAIPTYLHAQDNLASAATADACGFPDRGWRVLGLFAPVTPEG